MGISQCCISREKKTEEIMRKEMLVQYLKQIERKENFESVRATAQRPRLSEDDIQEVDDFVFARP